MIERCPWYIAGPLLGLLIVGLRAATNKPFGALGGFIELVEHARTPGRLGPRAYLLTGLIIGGALFAVVSHLFSGHPIVSEATTWGGYPASAALLVVAGLVMGFGARTAGGCTSGHGMAACPWARPQASPPA